MNYLSAGSFLNRNCYKITRFMAQGGFGITYLAEEIGYFKRSGFEDDYYVQHPQPEKVVVKELYYSDYCQRNDVTGLVSISNTEKKVEFEKLVNKQLEEGKILRRLKHPNIVRTRDIFKENGTAYMVMDFEESTDLEEQVKKLGRLEKGKALKYIDQILQAVQYIHNEKILHLDITPSNILVRKGTDEAVLIDFGASLTYDTQNKAKSNTSKLITGMKRHFAPVEQADIDNLKHFDATFDTYAIGASLYYILTGQLPPLSSMVSTGKERITPPSESVKDPGLNEYLDAVIIKAMAPKFHDRFSTAASFHQMLQDEAAYTERVDSIKKTISSGKFKGALEEIKAVSNNFLFTETLNRLKIQCEQELERKVNEEQYQRFLGKGQEWFNKQEYHLAINEFEKAGMTLPGKTEHNEKIKLCKKEIEKQLAQQQLKDKIDDLLFDARQSMADRKYSEAKLRAETILKSTADNKDALQILEQIKNLEQNEISRLKAQAEKLYTEEQYPEALKIYRLLQPKDVMDPKTAQILVKLRDSDKLIELSNKFSGLSGELNKINKEADGAVERISDLRKRYTEAEDQRHNVKLVSGSLRKLSDELNVGLSAALNMANEALERKTRLIIQKKKEEEEKKTQLVNTSTPTEEPKKTIDDPKEDFEKSPKTVLISEETPSGRKVSIGKRAVIFIGSAAITIAIGLLVLKAVRGSSPDENFGGQSKDTVQVTPATSANPVKIALSERDLNAIQESNALSDESKSAIKNSNDIQELCNKIANAPTYQLSSNDIEYFKNHFCK